MCKKFLGCQPKFLAKVRKAIFSCGFYPRNLGCFALLVDFSFSAYLDVWSIFKVREKLGKLSQDPKDSFYAKNPAPRTSKVLKKAI